MFSRRQFLTRTLQGSSLVALGSVVPGFVARTAKAAEPGGDNVLVVVELTGGNDGLGTVIPYGDDLYHKARPTLRQTKDSVIKLDDHVGLHPSLRGLRTLWEEGRLAVVQGVGYPNPDRSHFESMDIWQSADPARKTPTGWLGRAAVEAKNPAGAVPILHVGAQDQPRAVAGAPGGGAISVGGENSFRLDVGHGDRQAARRRLVGDLSAPTSQADDLATFVQRRQVQTLTAVEALRELLEGPNTRIGPRASLSAKLRLVSALIARGFGTRIFYVSLEGFDTHADQGPAHARLMTELGDAINEFFASLKQTKHDTRVRVMTFSEFGRRVDENGSRGTDHGAASCLFVAGPSVKGGVVGKHPSLSDLGDGDLKYHTDFRRVYAAQLDGWLKCDSKAVLGAKWDSI